MNLIAENAELVSDSGQLAFFKDGATARTFGHFIEPPQSLGYTPPTSQEGERRNSLVERITAPDNTAVFLRLYQICFWSGGRQRYNTREGKTVRLAQPRFRTSRPPRRLRVETFPARFLSLVEERSMSQSVRVGAPVPTLAIVDGIPTTSSNEVDTAKSIDATKNIAFKKGVAP